MLTDTSVLIKEVTQSEISDVLSIAKATWEPTYREILSKAQIDYMYEEIYTATAVEKQIQDQGHIFLILYVADTAVGYASYSLREDKESVYKVHKLHIHPDFQGQKYGRALVGHLEKEVKNRGARMLEMNVNRYNPAVRFYERCGYQQAREENTPIGDFWMNDFVMYKELC
ncbi:GNAT family N-acetyltransferase [Cytophagaceae bacterium DM2B3-1]|uniref:GNAT family N-acetyltransferase n=1 Tax=Xanthocytophaga flava TaxID=3048013 RepID=A0ABT7CXN5_9BACT|nr:GNAT family N-acetyltransferase [Xanthocytophaga flavus]MDJ1466440.1 GNAT family N-acetyltransferase [Xanthocytophaga flavus]MDJ1498524.1 GNAT family N-acetyltransferase [Xanthocytophaga flavus]